MLYEAPTLREAIRKALGRDQPQRKQSILDSYRQSFGDVLPPATPEFTPEQRITDSSDQARCQRLFTLMQRAQSDWYDLQNAYNDLRREYDRVRNERLFVDIQFALGVGAWGTGIAEGVGLVAGITRGLVAIARGQSATLVRTAFRTAVPSGSSGAFLAAIEAFDSLMETLDLVALGQRHHELSEELNAPEMRNLLAASRRLQQQWREKQTLFYSIARDYDDLDCGRFGFQSIGQAR